MSFYALLEIQTQKERAGMTVLLASPSGDLEGIGRMIMVDICRPFLNVASLCVHAGELGVRRSSTHHVFVIY